MTPDSNVAPSSEDRSGATAAAGVAAPFEPAAVALPTWILWALWAAWAALAAWCVAGFPPSVDLPAHAAQLQTAADLLRGAPEVAAHYRLAFPVGYGVTSYLLLPVTLLANGAVAARVATWLALVLFPLGHAALARALGRSAWPAILGAGFAFNVSYWYGFVPTLFAWPPVLFAWALYLRALQRPSRAGPYVLGAATLSTLALLSHLVALGALLVGLGALALAQQERWRAIRLAAASVAVPMALSLTRVASLVGRTGEGSELAYDLSGHFNRGWKIMGALGAVDVTLCWVLAGAAVALWLWRRPRRLDASVALLLGLLALYLLTPMSVSRAWMVYPRLGVLVACAALLVADLGTLKRARWALVAVMLGGVGVTVARHVTFAREIDGLAELTAAPPPAGLHGGLSLEGDALPGSGLKVLEHLPQWWTARHGGLGHHFFADADHQPVRFVAGAELPARLAPETDAATFERFSALLVYGDGPLPPGLGGFHEVQRAGHWRRLER